MKCLFSFIAGVAVGILGTMAVRKYREQCEEEEYEEEIEETTEDSGEELEEMEEEEPVEPSDEELEEEMEGLALEDRTDIYKEVLKKTKYNKEYTRNEFPRLISEEEFGDKNYNEESLTWYTEDEILVGYQNIPISDQDIYDSIGDAWRDAIEDEEEVYVRNNKLKIDYMISKMPLKWSDLYGQRDED